jgi:excisionase family DNA binding protein
MQTHTEQHQLLSVPAFAARLGVQPSTIRAWLMARRISKVKLGRRVLIPNSEVSRLIERGLIPALPERSR